MHSVQPGRGVKPAVQGASSRKLSFPFGHRSFGQVKTLRHILPLQSGVQELERCYQGGQARTLEEAEQAWKKGSSDTTEPTEQGQLSKEKFDWLRTWYPLAIERDLPTDRPTPARLLGNAVVLWKDGDEQWRAFKDLCPHRLVPLSEGRIENGNLMCSYHGWEFKGDGNLQSIPQADNEENLKAAQRSKRSCCASHPCKVVDGLVWVYGSCEPGAEAEAATRGIESLRVPKRENSISIPWFMRDLPYGMETLLENVLDPSHVPFSHHGIQGNRFKLKKMHMKPATEIDANKGFSVTAVEPEGLPAEEKSPAYPYDLSYTPPSLIRYLWNNGNILATHAVPTDPGRCRLFFTGTFTRAPPKGVAGLVMKLMFSKWGMWIDHFTRNTVLDGDGVFLCYQSLHNMDKETGSFNAKQRYYMPASQDSGVVALQKWLVDHAQALPWSLSALDPRPLAGLPRSELLNRHDQHVKHCPSCSGAYNTFKTLRWVGAAAAVLAACWLAFSAGSGFRLRKLIGPVLVTALSAALAWKSEAFKRQFEFVDYRHPDH